MKKTPKWAPRFDEKLRQSNNAKGIQKNRKRGLRLYKIYEKVEVEVPSYVQMSRQWGYSFSLQYETIIKEREEGIRWLKPKQATLMRMQGKRLVELPKKAHNHYPVDLESC